MNELLKQQGKEISMWLVVCLFACFFPYGISGCISFPEPSRGQKEHFAIHLPWVLEGWEAVLNANMKTSPLCLSICAQRIVHVGFNGGVFQGSVLITGEITEISKSQVNPGFKPQINPTPTLGKWQICIFASQSFEVPENQSSSMWD